MTGEQTMGRDAAGGESMRAWVVGGALLLAACGRGGSAGTTTAVPVLEPERTAAVETSFAFLQAVRELPDGRVLVADPLGGLLVRLDIESGAMDPVGAEGAGPGEWRQPDAVWPLPGDSTLLVDLGNARLTVIDPDGRLVNSYPIALTPPAPGPTAASTGPAGGAGARGGPSQARASGPGGPGGPATEILNPRAVDRAGRIYFQGRPGPTAPGSASDSLEVRRWQPGSATSERLAGLRPPAVTSASSGGGNQVQVMVRPVPLAPQDDWAVAADGRVALVRADPYRVEWLHEDGRVVAGPEVAYAPVPVQDAEKERWLEALGSTGLAVMMTVENGATSMQLRRGGGGMPGPARGSLTDYDWPATLPPFRSGGARVDPLGRVWVERYQRADAPMLYDLFDERGELVSRVRLPAERRVIGFGEERLYATRVDALGLNWLEVYALPR